MNRSQNRKRKLFRWMRWIVGVLAILLLCVGGLLTYLLRASLPKLDGTEVLAGLSSDVTIQRDDLGVPTITAANRQDVICALGFLHGQERFFQMDLNRRFAAGELAALLGPSLVDLDKSVRGRRLRRVAEQTLAGLPPRQQKLARAYAEGVNAGLESLGARPPEYWMLLTPPVAWRPEDSLLVLHGMALFLASSDSVIESYTAVAREAIPIEAFQFFYPRGTDWDAALDGSVLPAAPLPDPQCIDFRKGWEVDSNPPSVSWMETAMDRHGSSLGFLAGVTPNVGQHGALGSNAWAIDGSMSANGSALVANDMHLNAKMPNHWYRVRMKWPDDSSEYDVVGVSLPGTAAMPAGSNGKVAWGSTYAHLDLADWIILDINPNDPNQYRTPEGWVEFEKFTEAIEVKGQDSISLEIRWTKWGPVIDREFQGKPVAERYVFQEPESMNFRVYDLMLASDVTESLQIASECGTPVVNILAGDHRGSVGWTVAGPLPRRFGATGTVPVSWADGSNGWAGYLSPKEHPRLVSPDVKYVFSANQRKLGSPEYLALCRAHNVFGARATQIRDALDSLGEAIPTDMLAIQLDNRALLLERWQELLQETLFLPQAEEVLGPDLSELKKHVKDWGGRARAESVGYRLVRGFRMATIQYVYEPLTTQVETTMAQQTINWFWTGAERPVWTVLTSRPEHLLNPRFDDYDALLLAAMRDVVREIREKQGLRLDQATWGQLVNHSIQHPLSRAVPWLLSWLDAPTENCSGGDDMPRMHTRSRCVTQRLAVSPGHENEGILHMPGGQSGHFLSPYYRRGHEAWVNGEPTPLLPGETKHRITIKSEK